METKALAAGPLPGARSAEQVEPDPVERRDPHVGAHADRRAAPPAGPCRRMRSGSRCSSGRSEPPPHLESCRSSSACCSSTPRSSPEPNASAKTGGLPLSTVIGSDAALMRAGVVRRIYRIHPIGVGASRRPARIGEGHDPRRAARDLSDRRRVAVAVDVVGQRALTASVDAPHERSIEVAEPLVPVGVPGRARRGGVGRGHPGGPIGNGVAPMALLIRGSPKRSSMPARTE